MKTNLYFHDYVFSLNNWKKHIQMKPSISAQSFREETAFQCAEEFAMFCNCLGTKEKLVCGRKEGVFYLNKIAKAVSIHHSSTQKFLPTNPLLIEKSASYPTVAYFCPSTIRKSVGFLSSVARHFSKKGKGMS